MINKIYIIINKFRNLDYLIIGEAFFYLSYARLLKVLPFSKVTSTLGFELGHSQVEVNNEGHLKILRDISSAIYFVSRFTPFESMCLVKAIASAKMLNRRNINSTLYLGTAKDENGLFIAHAWLRCGQFYICGVEEMHKFTTIAYFSKKGSKGENHGT